LENSSIRLALHWNGVVEIPLHQELAVSVDVNMSRAMISLPGYEDVVASPDLAHGQTIPREVS
jgi:hypothetical protein